ncbi:MAG: hypothetical protein OSB25_03255 [Salibacteraceae bacterium]|nr:hypothetical protein [Salibacteraceae bacterium]
MKGALIFIAFSLAFFVFVSVFEHFGRFSTTVRTVLFVSLISVSGFTFWKYIAVSLFKLLDFGKRITNAQAAIIIGKHFPNIKDKLLNTLELQNQNILSNNALVLASIDQREKELSPVPFSVAIDLKKNSRYARYTAVPVLILLIILLISPSIITDSTSRIVQYNTHFEAPAPFDFIVQKIEEEAVQFNDVEIIVELSGSKIPNVCYVRLNDGSSLKMLKDGNNLFSFTIRNIDKTQQLVFEAGGFSSHPYFINVTPRPLVKSISARANFPRYIEKENELFENRSSLLIPEGTKLYWNIETKNTSDFSACYNRETLVVNQKQDKQFNVQSRILKAGEIVFYSGNSDSSLVDSSIVRIQIIKDQLPTITSQQFTDTLSSKMLYFRGKINDDYGITALNFVYKDNKDNLNKIKISIPGNTKDFEYYFTWNLSQLPDSLLKPGVGFNYYFEVWDNDGVNGAKSSRTAIREFKVPSKNEIQEKSNEKDKKIKDDLEASIEEAKRLQRNIDKLNKKLMEKKSISWEEKKEVENLLKQQKNLQNQFEKIKRENEINNFKKSEFTKTDERIMEKQRQLEELMEKVMDEETKNLLEELQKLMEKNDKKNLQEKLDELKLKSEDVEKELDRSLELFKQLEFDRKLQETIDEIRELKEAQNKLREQTEEKHSKKSEEKKLNEEVLKKQEELNKRLENVEKRLDELDKTNKDLEKPNKMPDLDQEKKDAKKNMEKAKEQLSQEKKKDAAKSQEQAKKQLEKMEQKMQAAQEKMQKEQDQEDLEALRRLRQNLMQLSFDQEDLIEKIRATNPRDPLYVEHTKEQMRLSDNSKMIQDSLFALSKRNLNIQAMVNREISAMNDNMEKSIRTMENRKSGEVMNRQQWIMNSINVLALMLDESIQNAQKQQSSKKFGKKSCSKPGSGMGKSMSDIKKLQKQLSDQIKKMKEAQKGKKPGDKPGDKPGNKPGEKGGRGSKSGESMAKMAAQQAAIRQELRRLSEELGGSGQQGGASKEMNRLQGLMEKNEVDLVNMKIDQETIKRQEEIMTRMLESEKAEREREYDNKRESKTAQDVSSPSTGFLKYQDEKKKQVELLETIPPNLKPFYRNLVNDYYNNL